MVKDANEFRTNTISAASANGGGIPAAKPSLVGFVGLGRMGAAMAANLAAAGYRVIAYVRRPDQMDKLAALGLEPTTNIADLFDCEVVISMLPDDTAVRDRRAWAKRPRHRRSRLGIEARRNSSFHEHDKHSCRV